jgi:PAS domain S-box-containing protein
MPVYASEHCGRAKIELVALALQACPAGTIVAGNDGVIVLSNGEAERLFGFGRGELIGRPLDLLLPVDPRTGNADLHGALPARPRPLSVSGDFVGRRKDGGEFPVAIGLNTIYIDGESLTVMAVADGESRPHHERIEDDSIATVSHELRTPLTAIAGSLGLLLAGGADSLPQPAAHLLKIAHDNCLRLVRMVSDILDSKKLQSGRMAFHFARYEARALLEQAIEANGGLAAICGAGIRLEAPPAPIAIEVDADRFIQILTNLLSNALKFTDPGDDVVVSLERRGAQVRISVRDRGPGIPEEFKPLVFEAFTQADGAAGRRRGGSGLGLSITRDLVAHMHGRIGFADAAGGGTVFHVDLPAADRAAGHREQTAERQARSG